MYSALRGGSVGEMECFLLYAFRYIEGKLLVSRYYLYQADNQPFSSDLDSVSGHHRDGIPDFDTNEGLEYLIEMFKKYVNAILLGKQLLRDPSG